MKKLCTLSYGVGYPPTAAAEASKLYSYGTAVSTTRLDMRDNRYLFPGQLEGFFFTIFAIAIAAAETAVAIAIIINIYRNLRNIEVKNLDELKD